jgi:hypothetical protein
VELILFLQMDPIVSSNMFVQFMIVLQRLGCDLLLEEMSHCLFLVVVVAIAIPVCKVKDGLK